MADDDTQGSGPVQTGLQATDNRVGAPAAAPGAGDVISRLTPQVLVVHTSLPGPVGTQIHERLRESFEEERTAVLFLSVRARASEKTPRSGGADDQWAELLDLDELERRISDLSRRYRENNDFEERVELKVRDLWLDTSSFKAHVRKCDIPLTPIEFEVLRYLMSRAGEVISAEQLLQDVWNYDAGAGDSALVDMQITNLRHKIEESNHTPTYIHMVHDRGYMIAV